MVAARVVPLASEALCGCQTAVLGRMTHSWVSGSSILKVVEDQPIMSRLTIKRWLWQTYRQKQFSIAQGLYGLCLKDYPTTEDSAENIES